MKGRPPRMTREQFLLLQTQSVLWGQVMSLKELSVATGFSRSYCRDVMEHIRKGITVNLAVSKRVTVDTLRE